MIAPIALSGTSAATLPPEVRDASAGAQQEYRSALAFERVLLGQLTKAMQATVSQDGEGSAATQAYKNMLPDTMADAMIANGGIGLASDLVRALRTDKP